MSEKDEKFKVTDSKIDFPSFLLSLGQTALIQMGEEADPITGKREKNLLQAKEMIDLVELLQEKTRGNLSQEEEALMQNLLYTLKMRYVKAAGQ